MRPRSDRLFAIAHRILRDVDRAEDALQEALVIAWRDLGAGSELAVPKLTYTVPAGWVNAADWPAYYRLLRDTPASRAAAAQDGIAEAIVVVRDLLLSTENCVVETAPDLEAGLSSGAIIDALATREGLATTTPTDITLAGLTGRRIDIRLDPAWTTECAVEPGSPGVRIVGISIVHPGDTYRAIILDTPTGNIGVMVQTSDPVEFDEFATAATPVIESFELDLP